MIIEILIPFLAIFIAELGDKTQLAILSMSSKTKNYFRIFFGSMLAFFLVDGIAIFLGTLSLAIFQFF